CKPVSIPMTKEPENSKQIRENDKGSDFPYRQAVGALMHLMVETRPDLAFSSQVDLSPFTRKVLVFALTYLIIHNLNSALSESVVGDAEKCVPEARNTENGSEGLKLIY
ncbi:hypothetical protein ILUMI_14367, partial [Ignelater luminosus]